MEKLRILVVDDSLVVRRVVMEELQAQPDLEVSGAANGVIALQKMADIHPDLVILDIEMPEMDGLTALTHLRKDYPKTPVIMFSSLTELGAAATLEALSRGASDFFAKPKAAGLDASRNVIRAELIPAVRALCKRPTEHAGKPNAATAKPAVRPCTSLPPLAPRTDAARIDVIAIGASTGGPNALAELFAALPSNLPVPILIVQHMPPMFTNILAERLTKNSKIATVEAASGMELAAGRAWIAPGDFHLILERDGYRMRTKVHQEPHENACRPAADPLFRSVASTFGPNCLAVVLTGMGQDGLRGCEAIKAAGGQVIVQDEETSVVWGMPGHVARAGFADSVLPLAAVAGEIVHRVSRSRG